MDKKEQIYKKLERAFVSLPQVLSVSKLNKNTDKNPFVIIPKTGNSVIALNNLTALKSSSVDTMVREIVYEKLLQVDHDLKKINPNWQLAASYGWRDLLIQQTSFDARYEILKGQYSDLSDTEIREKTHSTIAAPEVAGHPTGGAVDVCIVENGKMLDFGTSIGDWTNRDIYAWSPFVSRGAQENRKILRKAMMGQDFAPFDGEWWHYSYGDREWAYNKKRKIYLFSQKQRADIVIKQIGRHHNDGRGYFLSDGKSPFLERESQEG